MTWKIKGSQLQYQDWFYHCYHLDNCIKDCSDCKICNWYKGLNTNTVKEMSTLTKDKAQ